MDDTQRIQALSSLCTFYHEMEEGRCIKLSFYKDEELLGGTIRRHPEKPQILEIVAEMTHLRHLDLRKCKAKSLPEIQSRSLEHLDLCSNDLDFVPSWIVQQPRLTYLGLGANNIEEVPDLSSLPLSVVKLHKNRLSSVPRLGEGVKNLNLFLNRFSEFPESVTNITSLEVLTFGVSAAKEIPPLGKLERLRWLTLTVNQLESLPDDICSLVHLEGLQLAKNKLKYFPKNIGDLQNLKALTAYSNNLEELPESFYRLRLQKLNLYRNRLGDTSKAESVFRGIEFFKI